MRTVDGTEPKMDGRRARAEDSRRRATGAMLELIRETGEVPTADAIAERAGLSRRTVFRLFEDLDDLRRSAVARQREEVWRRFPPPAPSGERDADVEALVAHRAAVYEFIAPVRRVADRLEPQAVFLDARALARQAHRLHVELMIGPYLPIGAVDRRDHLDAAAVATSWQAWRALRDELGHDAAHAERVTRVSVLALLRRDP